MQLQNKSNYSTGELLKAAWNDLQKQQAKAGVVAVSNEVTQSSLNASLFQQSE